MNYRSALFALLLLFGLGPIAITPAGAETDILARQKIINVRMSDGVDVAVAVYLPETPGPFPTLFAASPYRLDNDSAPAVPIFTFRETGPIAWYLDHGYAFVRMDVRGTGRSGGDYHFQDEREQRDLYEVVEWIASQSWSNGRVGGIGQSAYARSQWFLAAMAPPHLACIAPYDGNIDTYRASAYTGGIPGTYVNWWYNYTRNLNLYPHSGEPRELTWDYPGEVKKHPTYDAFWRERAVGERLSRVNIPVFSIGVWGKTDLHLNGNIVGYQRVAGPKKLLVLGGSGVDAAVSQFASTAFHERYMLPFYDWCLKGKETSYQSEPNVRYTVTGSNEIQTATEWPPKNVNFVPLFLSPARSNSVTSLNDGSLTAAAPSGGPASTEFAYPNADWSITGVVAVGKDGKPDTARNVLSFTTEPYTNDTVLAGPILLQLALASTRSDADIIAKVYEQYPRTAEEEKNGVQPRSRLLTKGWLRASHRKIDEAASRPYAPWYTHTTPEPLQIGQIYSLDLAIMPTAARIHAGSRIRLEIANSDSMLTEGIFAHGYNPDQVGSYSIFHSPEHASKLFIPVLAPSSGR